MGAKGEPKTGGRKAGTPNKISASLRDDILQAAELAHKEGRVAYLKEAAQTNMSAFLTLLGKILPTDVNVKDTTPAKPPEKAVPPTDVMDASERVQRALRGEDFNSPISISPADESATHH